MNLLVNLSRVECGCRDGYHVENTDKLDSIHGAYSRCTIRKQFINLLRESEYLRLSVIWTTR